MSAYCTSGGATGSEPTQKLSFKKGRKIEIARNRVSNHQSKANALHVIYDNLDPSSARVALRKIADKNWRKELSLSIGVNSPYRLSEDELTRLLMTKPGAEKVGAIENWNRWPKNLAHGDKWLEEWLKNNQWATKDGFGAPYQTEPYGFSLKIDAGPAGWTEAKMKDWGNPIIKFNDRQYKHFRQAQKMVVEQYSHFISGYMSLPDVVASDQFKQTKNKSLGFFGHLGTNKIEVAQNPQFQRVVRDFIQGKMPAFHMAFPKPETMKVSKITRKGPRMIVGAALEMEIVERMASQNFALEMAEKRWSVDSKIGIHNNEWNQLFQSLVERDAYAVDYSFQDLRMPRQFSLASVSLRFDNAPKNLHMLGNVTYPTDMVQKAFSRGVVDSRVVGPDGSVWERHHGVPSGMYNTAPINTTNHQILNRFIQLECGVPLAEVWKESRGLRNNQYGDDYLGALPESWKVWLTVENYTAVVKSLGMEFTHDAIAQWIPRTGPIPDNVVFLQRTFERMDDGTVTARFLPHRMMSKFMTCHSDIQSPRQSYERALNMLNLTGNNPREYGIISAYIKHLGYTPPSYSYIMRTHYIPYPGASERSVGRIHVDTGTGIEHSKEWQTHPGQHYFEDNLALNRRPLTLQELTKYRLSPPGKDMSKKKPSIYTMSGGRNWGNEYKAPKPYKPQYPIFGVTVKEHSVSEYHDAITRLYTVSGEDLIFVRSDVLRVRCMHMIPTNDWLEYDIEEDEIVRFSIVSRTPYKVNKYRTEYFETSYELILIHDYTPLHE